MELAYYKDGFYTCDYWVNLLTKVKNKEKPKSIFVPRIAKDLSILASFEGSQIFIGECKDFDKINESFLRKNIISGYDNQRNLDIILNLLYNDLSENFIEEKLKKSGIILTTNLFGLCDKLNNNASFREDENYKQEMNESKRILPPLCYRLDYKIFRKID